MLAASAVATAAPTYRAMLETPEASPTCSCRTHEVAADDDGPLERPIPTAIARIGNRKAAYCHPASTRPMPTNPAAIRMKPTPITWRPPSQFDSLGTNGATTTSPTVAG